MSTRKQLSALEVMEVDQSKEKRKHDDIHSYACKAGGRCESSPKEQRNVVTTAVDIAHRVGRLRAGEDKRVNSRPIIIRFTTRTARDLIWKHAKQSPFLKTQSLRFKEDLTAADKEARSRLWPAVDRARKEGKAAYFSGARAFIDGKEILPT
ncbi:hypothetical protein F2P79_019241 [Pimephales promelas]|nr:hypothetical protein F2P79_019241 [Pimephales promelas]